MMFGGVDCAKADAEMKMLTMNDKGRTVFFMGVPPIWPGFSCPVCLHVRTLSGAQRGVDKEIGVEPRAEPNPGRLALALTAGRGAGLA